MSGSFLTYLDILIGFALVMLLASSIVTVLSQWLLNLRNYRAVVLREGLKLLLIQVDGQLEPHAGEIVQAILRHPLVAGRDWKGQEQDGRVIQREGLVRVLLELATTRTKLRKKAGEALRKALDLDPKDGDGPQATLDAIQARVVQLEIEFPNAAAHFLRTRAIVENASGRLVSGLMSWFDETADRMTQYFAQRARAVTIALSAVVALALPLDAFDLLTRLSLDEALRSRLVEAAQTIEQATPAQDPGYTRVRDLRDTLENLAIVPTGGIWTYVQGEDGCRRLLGAIPGILLSICLMSLGGPFWFEALKNLLKLRPVLAQKEEKERQERREVLPGGAGVVPAVRGPER
ncbi:MAG: hypothetical protein M3461_21230 [Pseudomonadota bacterium]|nr:hypothetical protein [Pseudomonadota bacterium]